MSKYAKVKPLFTSPAAVKGVSNTLIKQSVDSLATRLKKGREKGRFQIQLVGKGRAASYCLDVDRGQCNVATKRMPDADLEIVTDKDAWMEMAKGKLSPVDAFITGRMELHGDFELGKKLLARVSSRRQELPF
jgi:putative sterol carrier protein